MRTRLETLRLEFPFHAISMQTIGDKLFYLAEATDPRVQPRFAQAESTERLRAKLSTPVREFTTTEPSIPRVWDALLGGKDNFAVDREQAAKLLSVFPQAGQLARESREFQRRAISFVAATGVCQFLDIGCGLPTSPATHEVAQQVQPGSAVVYVDNDALVMSHARNLLARTPGVVAVAGDLAHPDEILYDWRVRQALDFKQPVAILLTMILHFFDAETARTICARLINELAPGSYLIVSTGHLDGHTGQQLTGEYQAGQLHHHTREEIAGFLDGLELIKPGITEAREWRDSTLLTCRRLVPPQATFARLTMRRSFSS
jgi:O-methyltransferase involved in polyketide biosynthesis